MVQIFYYVKMTAVIIWIRNLVEDEDSFSKLGSVDDPIRNLVVLGTKEEKTFKNSLGSKMLAL